MPVSATELLFMELTGGGGRHAETKCFIPMVISRMREKEFTGQCWGKTAVSPQTCGTVEEGRYKAKGSQGNQNCTG